MNQAALKFCWIDFEAIKETSDPRGEDSKTSGIRRREGSLTEGFKKGGKSPNEVFFFFFSIEENIVVWC